MKIISFDVGIKNMAYCVLQTETIAEEKTTKILYWNVLNLMPQSMINTDSKQSCSHCKKKAVYSSPLNIQPLQHFCIKHATNPTSTTNENIKNNFLLPIPKLNQMKKKELMLLFDDDNNNKTKLELLNILQKRILLPIKSPKQLKTQEIGLVEIGRSLYQQLYNLQTQFVDLDFILIENQISPIATRMKTIQGMLAMFFIQYCPIVPIHFISSYNKLTVFDKPSITNKITIVNNNSAEIIKKKSYASNKKEAVILVLEWLKQENNSGWATKWINFFLQQTKTDDYSDCLLQGLWFIKKHNTT